MSYAQAANRPNPVAALGALGAPAAFGVLLVFGLAIKAGIEQRDTTLVGVTVPIDEPPPPPEPLPKPKDDTASKTVTDQVPQYLPPPRPDTPFTFDKSANDPITTLTGPGELIGPVEPVDFGIPTPPITPRFDPVTAAPRGNPGGWVTDNDYRSSWISRGYSGVASFTLAIDARGRVTGCTITSSTGYSALDEATCRLLESRARFDPAKDTSGNTVAGSYRSSIRWRIPE